MAARGLAVRLLLLLLLATARAWAQDPSAPVPAAPAPSPAETVAEVSVVAGNVASAKRRALDEAMAIAVERAFSESLGELGIDGASPLPSRLADLRATLRAGARRFVRSYRLLGEEDLGGRLRVRVDVNVDGVALRRSMTDATVKSGVAPPEIGSPVLLTGTGPADLSERLARALGAHGLTVQRVRAAPGIALAFTATVEPAGEVRGPDLRARVCHLTVVVRARDDRAVGSVNAEEYGFGSSDPEAERACLDGLVAAVTERVVAQVAAAGKVDGSRAVVALFLFDQPAVVERILDGIGRMSRVARVELRRVAIGWAEFRVTTETPAATLAPLLVRELGKDLVVETVGVDGGALKLKARLPEPAAPAAEAPLPPPLPAGARP